MAGLTYATTGFGRGNSDFALGVGIGHRWAGSGGLAVSTDLRYVRLFVDDGVNALTLAMSVGVIIER